MMSDNDIASIAYKCGLLLLEGNFEDFYNLTTSEVRKEYPTVQDLINGYENMIKSMGYVKETISPSKSQDDGYYPDNIIISTNFPESDIGVCFYIHGQSYQFVEDEFGNIVEDEEGFYIRLDTINESYEPCGIMMTLDLSQKEIKITDVFFGI